MNAFDELRDSLAALVAIVSAYNTLHGRVRLQKLAYLLQQAGFGPLQHVRFSYHHYGPYSDQLAGVLDQAVASDLVKEHVETTGEQHRQFTYEVNRDHEDLRLLNLDEGQRQTLASFHEVTEKQHWRTLELAATIVYLQRRRGFDRVGAIDRAIRLKPACSSFRPDAISLLSALGL